jgi:EAL domain-containing protein (putative c-di-GMP-specific phosphodiesterase class I)
LNVNLAAPQLGDADACPTTSRTALADARLEPGRLMLEITETVLLRDYDAAMTVFAGLREARGRPRDRRLRHGVLVTQRTSGNLPVDEIKIDRSFITPITESEQAAKLVHAIIQLADDLHLRTVAEGVETQEQLSQLRTTKCELVQGYLFAVPLSEQQIRRGLQHGELRWSPGPQNGWASALHAESGS